MRFRVSIATIMFVVIAVAAASALFLKARDYASATGLADVRTDAPVLLILALALTTVALGSWKDHSLNQILLQGAVACLAFLSLIWVCEAGLARAVRYWFQSAFALTVTLPLLARRYIKVKVPKGLARERWKKNCEAVFFAFLGVMLVTVGGILEMLVSQFAYQLLSSAK